MIEGPAERRIVTRVPYPYQAPLASVDSECASVQYKPPPSPTIVTDITQLSQGPYHVVSPLMRGAEMNDGSSGWTCRASLRVLFLPHEPITMEGFRIRLDCSTGAVCDEYHNSKSFVWRIDDCVYTWLLVVRTT